MGGDGSGNRWQGGKRTTDGMLALDIRRLHRGKLLISGRNANLEWSSNGRKIGGVNVTMAEYHLTLRYSTSEAGKWEAIEWPVSITWTACRFGGRRPWFLCPRCSRRVAVLYAVRVFACRHCHKLAYASQREDVMSRAMRRAWKIEGRLGWENRYSLRAKPKGMHWRTFERLVQAHDHHNRRSWLALATRFNLFPG